MMCVMHPGAPRASLRDQRTTSSPAPFFGFFPIRRGMHFADGGIARLVNTCGVGIAMELELMGEPIDAQRARECHLVNRVVPQDELMTTAEDVTWLARPYDCSSGPSDRLCASAMPRSQYTRSPLTPAGAG